MTNLLTRIKNTVMADINEALDKKENKNPIALLNQYLRECEVETEKVRKLVERQSQLKDQFTREHHQALEMAEKRKYQTEIAMRAGEAELQGFASQEQAQYEERANIFLCQHCLHSSIPPVLPSSKPQVLLENQAQARYRLFTIKVRLNHKR